MSLQLCLLCHFSVTKKGPTAKEDAVQQIWKLAVKCFFNGPCLAKADHHQAFFHAIVQCT